jgi:hypothetical protein
MRRVAAHDPDQRRRSTAAKSGAWHLTFTQSRDELVDLDCAGGFEGDILELVLRDLEITVLVDLIALDDGGSDDCTRIIAAMAGVAGYLD